MGYRAGHTKAAAFNYELMSTEREAVHLRDSLIGNSMHTPTIAVLLAPTLVRWQLLPALPNVTGLEEMEPKHHSISQAKPELLLARRYASYQTHRSNEIRLENGPMQVDEKPSWQAVRASQWIWKPFISCAWQVEGDSMPALNIRAVVLALKWRARSVVRMSKKFLYLADFQSALGSYARHRSLAYSLNYLIDRGCALKLATRMELTFAFVRTHLNPADKPSRMLLPLTSSAGRKRDFRNLCSMEECLQIATSLCDNCQQSMCSECCSAFDKGHMLCSLCCASPEVPRHQVTQRLGTPLQPGPLVTQRLGTPLLPTPPNEPLVKQRLGTPLRPGEDTSGEIHRNHRSARWRCTACDRRICHPHTLSNRRRARCWECGLDRAEANPPSLSSKPLQRLPEQQEGETK
jgi:hypothetical protein